MRTEWSDAGTASARRFMRDQEGMRAVGEAVLALAADPLPGPPLGFHKGTYHRLRVGAYRIVYTLAGELITIRRVDRVTGP